MRDALEPDTRAFLESLPFPAGERLSVAQMRDRESQMQANRLVREIAHGAEAAVVIVDYSWSPEARYPVAVEQVYAVLVWVRSHGGSIGVDLTRVALVCTRSTPICSRAAFE